jgi:hypothetical protein
VAAATAGLETGLPRADDDTTDPTLDSDDSAADAPELPGDPDADALIEQAMNQSDEVTTRERDSEY